MLQQIILADGSKHNAYKLHYLTDEYSEEFRNRIFISENFDKMFMVKSRTNEPQYRVVEVKFNRFGKWKNYGINARVVIDQYMTFQDMHKLLNECKGKVEFTIEAGKVEFTIEAANAVISQLAKQYGISEQIVRSKFV